MPEPVFVIHNQHGLYLTRQNEWVDGHDPAPLFKAAFRDVALNTLIELNAKDIELRGVIIEVEVNDKGLPRVVPAEHVSNAAAVAHNPAPASELTEAATDTVAVNEAEEAIDGGKAIEGENVEASGDDVTAPEHSGN